MEGLKREPQAGEIFACEGGAQGLTEPGTSARSTKATDGTQTILDYGDIENGDALLSGIQALVRLPIDLMRRDRRLGHRTALFISGYEGSPLGGYDLELERNARLLRKSNILFKPGLNEELAATAVQGAQLAAIAHDAIYAGVAGIWYGKSPGLDRAADALRHANLMGTHRLGGAIALVGDDPGAKSSTVPGACEPLLADLGIPMLYPSDSQDILDLGVHALAMSRASGLWSALKITTNVADGRSVTIFSEDRVSPVFPAGDGAFRHKVSAHMLQPVVGDLERSRNGDRRAAAERYVDDNRLNSIVGEGGARIGVVAAGKTYLDLSQALDELGLDLEERQRRGIRLLRVRVPFPLSRADVFRFSEGLREIIVVEEKRAFIETAIKGVLYGRPGAPAVFGKTDPSGAELFPSGGELDPDVVASALARRLLAHGDVPSVAIWHERSKIPKRRYLPIASRTPYFCSGCPHNSSTKVPENTRVGAGIGCHGLAVTMDEAMVGKVVGLFQMGGEGAQWIGMAPFVDGQQFVQNLGDGTFHHSGSLAVRAAIASGATMTYKLLYNSAVAMTGGQQPVGRMSVPAITRALEAEGVKRIIVTTEDPRRYPRGLLGRSVEVWHRDRLVEAQETLAKVSGVTLLIHDQECATELRRKRKRGLVAAPSTRITINSRICEGCGDCGEKSNCLSLYPTKTDFGRKTQVNQSSCNVDYSCLRGNCPSFMSVETGGLVERIPPSIEAASLLEPSLADGPWTIRIVGIGGSGVVTLSALIGTAARVAGRTAQTLDQTGMAQKGGAVVSDVKIRDGDEVVANRAAAGECDLYLVCDLLAGAAENNLLAVAAHTMPIVSTSEVPTGQMVTDVSRSYPDPAVLLDRIRQDAGGPGLFVDARALSVSLFDDEQFANVLLMGIAYQHGGIPVPAQALEEALRLNGVKVESNVQAFRWGRRFVLDPDQVERRAGRGGGDATQESREGERLATELLRGSALPTGSALEADITMRAGDLVGYQDPAYAQKYTEFLQRVYEAESRAVPGSTLLLGAVAVNLYKLMAYKDEYEIARLALDRDVRGDIARRFGAGARVTYRLHPPILRAMGVREKISLGPWFDSVFRLLVVMRRLRGTHFDPFGYARMRRLERELVGEYRQVIEAVLKGLTADKLDVAVEIAGLPDMVRGYESVKLRSVGRYRAAMQTYEERLGAAPEHSTAAEV